MILCWFTNKWSVYLKCGHDPEQVTPETIIWVKWSNCLFNTNWDRIGVLLIAQCFFLRWDQCSVEAGQHSGRTDELETSQQSGMGPEVYIGAGPGNTHISTLELHLRCWLCVYTARTLSFTSLRCSPGSWRSLCTGGTGVHSVLSSFCGWRTSWTTNVMECVCTWSHRECCLLRYTNTISV